MFGTEIPLRLVLIVLTILCLTGMGGAILGLTGPIIAVLALTSGITAFGALAQWCSYLLILWRSHRLRQNKFIQKSGFRTIMTERKYIEGHLLERRRAAYRRLASQSLYLHGTAGRAAGRRACAA